MVNWKRTPTCLRVTLYEQVDITWSVYVGVMTSRGEVRGDCKLQCQGLRIMDVLCLFGFMFISLYRRGIFVSCFNSPGMSL